MKTFIVVLIVTVWFQSVSTDAQNVGDSLKGVGVDLATTLARAAAKRLQEQILNSFLPEDRHELTNGNVLTMQGGSWKQAAVTNLQEPPKQYLVRVKRVKTAKNSFQ